MRKEKKNENEKYRLIKVVRGGASVRKSEIKQVVDLPASTCRVPGIQECATKPCRFNTLKEKHIKHEYKARKQEASKTYTLHFKLHDQ